MATQRKAVTSQRNTASRPWKSGRKKAVAGRRMQPKQPAGESKNTKLAEYPSPLFRAREHDPL